MNTPNKPVQPITNPRRLLPLHKMNWSRDAYGHLLAFQKIASPPEDSTRYYHESSLDFPF